MTEPKQEHYLIHEAPAEPAQQPYVRMSAQLPYNTLAIVSFCISFFVPIAAVVLGHLALREMKKTPSRGESLAIVGLVIGYLGCVAWLIPIAVLIFAAITSVV